MDYGSSVWRYIPSPEESGDAACWFCFSKRTFNTPVVWQVDIPPIHVHEVGLLGPGNVTPPKLPTEIEAVSGSRAGIARSKQDLRVI